jgi:osmotically-inducible protein OsmY
MGHTSCVLPYLEQQDRQISDRIRQAFDAADHDPLRTIRATVSRGHVVLSGRVPSHFTKRLAEIVVSSLADVKSVHNTLQVETRLRWILPAAR